MTQKEIIKLATNERAMYLLNLIAREESNLCYKAKHELPNSLKQIKTWSKEINELIKSN